MDSIEICRLQEITIFFMNYDHSNCFVTALNNFYALFVCCFVFLFCSFFFVFFLFVFVFCFDVAVIFIGCLILMPDQMM